MQHCDLRPVAKPGPTSPKMDTREKRLKKHLRTFTPHTVRGNISSNCHTPRVPEYTEQRGDGLRRRRGWREGWRGEGLRGRGWGGVRDGNALVCVECHNH